MISFLAVEAFNPGDVIFFFFRNNVGTYDKEVIAATLFLSSAVQKVSIIVLIFFISLVLIDELFFVRYVSRGKVGRLILPKVFILFPH